jgi:ABC-2 type transport system permease protein
MSEHVRLQIWLFARRPGQWSMLLFTPLYCLVFFSVIRAAGRGDLAVSVGLSAFFMTMWAQLVYVASEAVDLDRSEGVMEVLLAAPASYTRSLVLRIATAAAICLPAALEIILIGVVGFDFPVAVAAPPILLIAVVLTFVGGVGTAVLLAGLFCLVLGARTYQNSLTYPCYLLGGLILPATQLPPPFAALSRLFFLSWGTDLARDSIAGMPDQLGWRLLVLSTLVGLQCAVGVLVVRTVLIRVRNGRIPLHG